ncbi:Eukaryotic translation initiation factor 3 subunit G [Sciurus carolinensis]|uniref:Eukaryotic translation initiation factor 3 subunit G n=1 Tax=Sciurus carolinensis TaxID=30640 RepID=A0AA41MQ89_SCICA|nr:Eukaryotic translation initiation factor 3 subunit G [Sciurus carolinensis]
MEEELEEVWELRFNPPGPNVATITVSDYVSMTFITSKEDLKHQEEENPMNKLKGQKTVSCHISKGDHCPYKNTQRPLQKELAEQLGLSTGQENWSQCRPPRKRPGKAPTPRCLYNLLFPNQISTMDPSTDPISKKGTPNCLPHTALFQLKEARVVIDPLSLQQ